MFNWCTSNYFFRVECWTCFKQKENYIMKKMAIKGIILQLPPIMVNSQTKSRREMPKLRPIACKRNFIIFLISILPIYRTTPPTQTHTSGGPIRIIFFLERYDKNSWDVCFGFFDFCVLLRLGQKALFLNPMA